MRKRIKIDVSRGIGLISISMLSILSLALIFPLTWGKVDALSNTTISAETRVAVKAAASVAVSVENQVNIDVVPQSKGAFGYSSTRLGVATNNEEGYQVLLTTGDGSNALKNTDTSKTGARYEISSIEGSLVGTSFTGNTWGYALTKDTINEQTTYTAVPTSLTSVYNTSSAPVGTEDVYNLGFGAHISTDLPAGEYSNSVIVSVIANPIKITSLSQLVYMQDMQPELCENTSTGVTKQLYDIRDGKQYWVAKLADGNCWMTQNLALDLSTDKALTPADSDVRSSWVPSSNTETEVPAPSEEWNATSVGSWNLGEIVLTNPTSSTLCPQSGVPNDGYHYPNVDKYSTVFHGQRITKTCSDFYRDVDDLTDGFVATATAAISADGKSYDAHYLLGNYYTPGAATAGSNNGLVGSSSANINPDDSVDVPESICPRGWKLPTSGRYFNDGIGYPYEREDSLMSLLVAYGLPKGNASAGWSVFNSNPYAAFVGDGRTRVDYAPLYFVKAGTINPKFGAIRSAGSSGSIETGTVYSGASDLFIFTFDVYNAFPSSASTEYVASQVRCLAK